MAKLSEITTKIRSKNAGPFWLTLDIFCGSNAAFERVCRGLSSDQIARIFDTNAEDIKRFDLPELNVIKISMPRPAIQGSVKDRDIHGASWATLMSGISLP